MTRKIKIFISLIAVIAVGTAVFLVVKQEKFQPKPQQKPQTQQPPKQTYVEGKMVDNFPKDIPAGDNIKPVRSFTDNDSKGGEIKTGEFLCESSIDKCFDIYYMDLVKNGWKIAGFTNDKDQKVISADKNSQHVRVLLVHGDSLNQTKVTMNFRDTDSLKK